jgi:hypothetical protein
MSLTKNYMVDRPVHKLPFGPKCHELFAILYSIPANLSENLFCYCISKTKKNEFGQNPEEKIILTGPGQYIANSSWHRWSYGSIWTGPSPKKYYMDRSL